MSKATEKAYAKAMETASCGIVESARETEHLVRMLRDELDKHLATLEAALDETADTGDIDANLFDITWSAFRAFEAIDEYRGKVNGSTNCLNWHVEDYTNLGDLLGM